MQRGLSDNSLATRHERAARSQYQGGHRKGRRTPQQLPPARQARQIEVGERVGEPQEAAGEDPDLVRLQRLPTAQDEPVLRLRARHEEDRERVRGGQDGVEPDRDGHRSQDGEQRFRYYRRNKSGPLLLLRDPRAA
ncbi:hypothetical protein PG989_001821 [Apiospora arundinis]